MLGHSLLGILLHARVDGGVDFQSVVIYVILRAVGLGIFFNPAIQRIGLPGNGVVNEFLPLPASIVGPLGTLGPEHAAQFLTEIWSYAVLDIHTVEIKGQRQC